MSLRATFVLIGVSLATLVLGVLGVMTLGLRSLAAQEVAESRRYESYKLADELRQSSDDLTRMARTYVVTGNARYEEYFKRILAIRNGEAPRPENYDGIYWDLVTETGDKPTPDGEPVALEDLMRRANFTDLEFAKLRDAQGESDALVALEARAMAAVKGRYPDEDGKYTRAGPPDLALARGLLHGEAYHAAKSRIMTPIDEFLEMVESRTQREIASLRARSSRLMLTALALVFLALALVGASVFVIQRRVEKPVRALVAAARALERGEHVEVPAHRPDEMGLLSRTFNHMSDAIRQDIDRREQAKQRLARQALEERSCTRRPRWLQRPIRSRTPSNRSWTWCAT